jgi:small-conductance mechanosensitive channel
VIDFSKLVDWSYLVNPRPGASFKFSIHVLIISAVLLVLAFLAKPIIRKVTKGYKIHLKFASRLATLLWVTAVSALILLFFRTQGIPVVSVRILWPILALVSLSWMAVLLIWASRAIPKEVAEIEEQKRKEIYIPKRKKRRKKK